MALELIRSITLLLGLIALCEFNTRLWGARRQAAELCAGLIFGFICVVGMTLPITLAPGVIVDARSAALSMAGFFGGPVVAGIAAVIAGAYRLWLGGDGAFAGLAVIASSALLGLAYRHAVRRQWAKPTARHFVVFACVVYSVALLWITMLPTAHVTAFFGTFALIYFCVMTPATALLGILLQDLEEQRLTRQSLIRSEALRYAITHASPDILFVLDEDGRYLEIIAPEEGLLYAEAASVLGKTMAEVLPPAIAERLLGFVRQALDASAPQIIEYVLDTLDGRHVFEARAQAIDMLIEGKRAIVFVARDISERVAADQERRIAAIAFESQEGMTITDAEGVILRVNKAFTEITGFRGEDVVGRNPRLLASGRQDAAFYAAMWDSVRQTGSWRGEIWNRRKSGEIYPEWLSITAVKDPAGAVTHYVGTFADITQRKLAEEQITKLAFYDPLTQLPNRRLMVDRLEKALRNSERRRQHGALLLIDLDNFKILNDTHGHDVGDQLLVEAAERLKSAIRDSDTVVRLGGDEFVVILEDLDGEESAAIRVEQMAVRIQEQLSEPYLLQIQANGNGLSEWVHQCTSSIGITLFSDQSVPVEELMRRADTAMYQAKAAGRNTQRFFDPAMHAVVAARAALENELRKAIVQRQFLVHYQAQVDASGRVTGAETLVRWQHPERGLIAPAEFIPLAEETGLILPLGHWVLETACQQLAAWATQEKTAHLCLAVNVSARQFSLPNFVEEVLALVDHTGAPPEKLKLELTESLLLANADDSIAKMMALRERGLGFSLDDFGTGYSSLSYLKRLPLYQLKIDRSFVVDILSDASDAAIAQTIVALADSLGLEVIAEGVETEEQRDFLARIGCHRYQGYLFSRPLPPAAFREYLEPACEIPERC